MQHSLNKVTGYLGLLLNLALTAGLIRMLLLPVGWALEEVVDLFKETNAYQCEQCADWSDLYEPIAIPKACKPYISVQEQEEAYLKEYAENCSEEAKARKKKLWKESNPTVPNWWEHEYLDECEYVYDYPVFKTKEKWCKVEVEVLNPEEVKEVRETAGFLATIIIISLSIVGLAFSWKFRRVLPNLLLKAHSKV